MFGLITEPDEDRQLPERTTLLLEPVTVTHFGAFNESVERGGTVCSISVSKVSRVNLTSKRVLSSCKPEAVPLGVTVLAELLPCEDVILLAGTVLGTCIMCTCLVTDGATRFVNRHIVYVATSSAKVSAVF